MKEIAKPRPWRCVGEPGLKCYPDPSLSPGLKVFVFGQAGASRSSSNAKRFRLGQQLVP